MIHHGFNSNLGRWWAACGHEYIDSNGNLWRHACDGPNGCLYPTEQEAIEAIQKHGTAEEISAMN